MSELEPLKVPKIPKNFLDLRDEDGISYNEAKKYIKELSGVPDVFKSAPSPQLEIEGR